MDVTVWPWSRNLSRIFVAQASSRRGKDDWHAFEHDRVHPVVHPLLQEMLGFVPPDPPRTVLDLVDAWTTQHTLTE